MKTIVAVIVALACLTVAAQAKHFDVKHFWAHQDRWVGGGQGQ